MSYAIIETGGKQIKVEPGRFYDIELLSAQPDEKVTIDKVLLVQHNGEVTIGQPLVTGATVEGTVLRHLRGRKVLVYKMKPKKKTRKKRGHRQEITRLMIDSISLNGSVLVTEATTADGAEAQVSEVVSEPGTVPPPEAPEINAESSEAVVDTIEASATTEA
ncbi:50S ribosomal protein L21 [Scytonema sp. UIC 10036]|uniref:50S ribosomal protein L21 n=1 Tax=Scytonema sp. UIC 10036 TaxID=2304196 RepID=UPI0012DAE560|nr:50S ribosomal protein L21 [Scytonema sp. UIC 10036]MUG95030.1 50S ribosomal protein L21 [Scytonema sp. UIC 10036]